jgi:hypothetical protein
LADPRRDKLLLRLGFGSASFLRPASNRLGRPFFVRKRGGWTLTHEPFDLKSGETTR